MADSLLINAGNNVQYDRQCELLVADLFGNALDLSEFRIKFSTKHSESSIPNTAEIRVYNLAQTTAVRVRNEFKKVILKAGYPGNIGTIFQGNIKQVIVGRESATDTFIDLICGDGDGAYIYSVTNKTLGKGSTFKDQIKAAADEMAKRGVQLGPIENIPNIQLPRGKVMYGSSADYFRNIAKTSKHSWSIQNEKIEFVPNQSYLPGTAVVLTSNTGMIGTPQQTSQGVNVKCLLNPLIKINTRIQIDNASVQRLKINLRATDPLDPTISEFPLSTDGVYLSIMIDHSGDTRGVEWYTTLIGVLIDASAPLLDSVGSVYDA